MKKEKRKGLVISDLHVLTCRVDNRYMPSLTNALKQADYLVLNGDIFDFKWSTQSSNQQSITNALVWLEELMLPVPECEFHYVLGNHDAYSEFVEALDSLAKSTSNFHVYRTHFIDGKNLFMHGDLPLSGQNPYKRKLETDIKIKSKVYNVLYDVLIDLSIHRVADILFSKKRASQKIVETLIKFPHDDLKPVKAIYFGHTHVPFTDYRCGGYVFYNTGSAVKGIFCQMLEVCND